MQDSEIELPVVRQRLLDQGNTYIVEQVNTAFDLIGKANGVTILSLDEMEAVVLRALSGEFSQ